MNKNVVMKKELITLTRFSNDKANTDKELIACLKNERDNSKKRLEVEKEKNRLVNLNIEEDRRLRA